MNTLGGVLAERRGTTAALRLTLGWWAVALAVGAVAPAPWGVALGVVVALSGSGAVDVVANVAATAALADRPGRLVRFHSLFNVGGAFGAALAGVLLGWSGTIGWRIAWAVRPSSWSSSGSSRSGSTCPPATRARRSRCPRACGPCTGSVWSPWPCVRAGGHRRGRHQHLGRAAAARPTRRRADRGGRRRRPGLPGRGGRPALGQRRADAWRARRIVVAGSGCGGFGLLTLATVDAAAAAGLVLAAGGISVCWPLLMSEIGRGRERPGMVVGAVSTVGYLGAIVGPGAIGLVAGAFGLSTGIMVLAVAVVHDPGHVDGGPATADRRAARRLIAAVVAGPCDHERGSCDR